MSDPAQESQVEAKAHAARPLPMMPRFIDGVYFERETGSRGDAEDAEGRGLVSRFYESRWK